MDIKSLYEQAKSLFLPQPLTHVVDGENYKVVPTQYGLHVDAHIRKPAPLAKPTLAVASLTGFVDAYKADIDGFDAKSGVHVIDHETVALISLEADEFGRRHEWVRAVNKERNPFPFGEYQAPEAFLLSLQAGFLNTDEVVQLQLLASTLTSNSSISVQDDGFTQTVTVKEGAVSYTPVPLPKRIPLMPYRTFREIDPVQSEFIVRLQGKQGEMPKIALLPVDGGRWKHDTTLMVKNWLADKLPTSAVVIA